MKTFNYKSIFKLISKPVFLLSVVILASLILSACTGGRTPLRGWAGVAVDGPNTVVGSMDGRVVSVNTATGAQNWSIPIQTPPSGGGFGCSSAPVSVVLFGSPAIDGDIVYIAGMNGKLYAISSSTRLSKDVILRKDDKSNPGQLVSGVTVAEGKVYVGSSDGRVYALDTIPNLGIKWQFATGDKIWSTPTVVGDTVYVTSFDKKIYALNAADGSKKWEYKTQGALVSQPVVDGGTVYFGSLDRNLYALDAATGSLKWSFSTVKESGKWFWATPVVHNGTVYAANLDGKVYAVNASNGQKLTELNLSSASSATPVEIGNQLFIATETGDIFSIDTATNTQKLLVSLGEKVYASLFANEGKIYVHTFSDKLYEIEAASGAKRELNIK